MNTRPKLLRNIARHAGITTNDVMIAARDLNIPFHNIYGDWLLNTDNATARELADHLAN